MQAMFIERSREVLAKSRSPARRPTQTRRVIQNSPHQGNIKHDEENHQQMYQLNTLKHSENTNITIIKKKASQIQ
jgi:hypothetical protein